MWWIMKGNSGYGTASGQPLLVPQDTEQFVLGTIPVSVEQHMQWMSSASLLCLCMDHCPLLSTNPSGIPGSCLSLWLAVWPLVQGMGASVVNPITS